MSPLDHDHPVNPERVSAARAAVLHPAGFRHQLLEHCLRRLLTVASPGAGDARP